MSDVIDEATWIAQEQPPQEEAITELRAMVVSYDGSAPFPEFVERYVQVHPSRWDFRGVSPYIFPLGDPRNRKDEDSHEQ